MLKWTVNSKICELETPKRLTQNFKQRKSVLSSNKENIVTSTPLQKPNKVKRLSLQSPVYASTLPKFAEEYSPSLNIDSGQSIAMRGLLPDIYLGNPRYLSKDIKKIVNKTVAKDQPSLTSTKMGDQTLDKLIDAILESGKKSLKKGVRRSMNLRRRTLLKNSSPAEILSPSYTPGEDPASDLSFSNDVIKKRKSSSPLIAEELKRRRKSRSSSPRVCKQDSDNTDNYFEVGLAMPSIYV